MGGWILYLRFIFEKSVENYFFVPGSCKAYSLYEKINIMMDYYTHIPLMLLFILLLGVYFTIQRVISYRREQKNNELRDIESLPQNEEVSLN